MTPSTRKVRFRQRFPVTVGPMTAFTVNLGAGGFCTELLRVLLPGTAVEGAIRVRNQEYPYSGRVAWVREGSPRLNVRGRMGIRFLSVAPEFEALLASLSPAAVAVAPARQRKA